MVILLHFSINLHGIFTLISILFKRKGLILNIYISCNSKKLPAKLYPYFLQKKIVKLKLQCLLVNI